MAHNNIEKGNSAENEVDVLVVGGGPSGLIAATASGRLGAKTLLIEHQGFLGGTATASMVGQFFGFFHNESQVVRGIPEELLKRIIEYGGASGFTKYTMAEVSTTPLTLYAFPFNPEIAKIAMDELVTEDSVRVLFHMRSVKVLMEEQGIAGVILQGIGEPLEIRAKIVVDATGDAVIAKEAGAEMIGEEEEFRRNRMPLTLVFRLTDVDVPRVRATPREEKRKIVLKGLEQGELFWQSLSFSSTPAYNDAICLMSRISGIDALNDVELSQAELIGRQQVKSIVNFLRREVPGFERCNLVGIAARVGVRETRRIMGRYTLTEQDIYDSLLFEDAVALGSGPLDIHEQGGTGLLLEMPKHPFQIPMRCLFPTTIESLIVTGRMISTTRLANSGIRHMGTSMALGQAAGTIAAVASGKGIQPNRVSPDEIKSILKENGAVLSVEDIH